VSIFIIMVQIFVMFSWIRIRLSSFEGEHWYVKNDKVQTDEQTIDIKAHSAFKTSLKRKLQSLNWTKEHI
jgi:hypothetical protein